MEFTIFKTLHILSMVAMVTAFIGAEIFYAAAIWRRDVRSLAWVQHTVEKTGVGFVALGGLAAGVIFGLLAAATGGIDFFTGWMIAAYVLVGLFLVNSALLGVRVVHVAKAAVEAVDGKGSVDDVAAGMAPNRGVVLVAINVVIFAALIVDMVVKPFSSA
jgi:uncharacterized membrane protein